MIQLRQVSRYVYDVFAGIGFSGWTRVRKQPWGIQVIGGNYLSRQECKRLDPLILQHPHGSVEPLEV